MHRSISLKWKYWLNYVFIGLIACATVGLSVYIYSMEQLTQNVNESAAIEISTAAAYLEEQIDVFEDIATRISTTSYYRESYRNASVSDQRKILDGLTEFGNYSPIIDSYFLYTRIDSKIWKSGAQNTFDYYASLVLKISDTQAFHDYLNTVETISAYSVDNNFVLICVPMHIDSSRNDAYDSVISFIVYHQTLDEYLSVYAPNFKGSLQLYINGVPLFDADPAWVDLCFETGPYGLLCNASLIAVDSSNGIFRIITDTEDAVIFSYTHVVRQVNAIIIILCLLIILSLAYLLASRSYYPIQQLLKRHQPEQKERTKNASRNELAQIDAMLTRSSMSESLLQKQADELRRKQTLLSRQFFFHLLNGSLNGAITSRADSLGIRLTGNLFRVINIRFTSYSIMETESENIEMLSDETMCFFCVPLGTDNRCVVIINVDDDQVLDIAEDLLVALCESGSSNFSITSSSKDFDDLSELSFMLSFTEIQKTAEKIYQAVTQHGKDEALLAFHEFLNNSKVFPPAQQLFVSSELIIRLVNDSEEAVRDSLRAKAALLMTEPNNEVRIASLENLLVELCMLYNISPNNDDYKSDEDILFYIDQNLNNCCLDISSIAQALMLTPKAVRKAIRERTNASPREYFNHRRVETAMELLVNTKLSVSEISQAVGYGSVSYFIKNFRMMTGKTPAVYRMEAAEAQDYIRIPTPNMLDRHTPFAEIRQLLPICQKRFAACL